MRELFVGNGTLTPRYVLWLIEWLGDDSATFAAHHGGPHLRGWGYERHVLTSVLEALRDGNWQRGGGKGPKPKPIERPTAQRRRVVTVAELNAKG